MSSADVCSLYKQMSCGNRAELQARSSIIARKVQFQCMQPLWLLHYNEGNVICYRSFAKWLCCQLERKQPFTVSVYLCLSVRLSLSLPLCVSRSLFASWIITNWFSTTPLADLHLTRPTNGHMPHWNLKHRSTARLSWGHSSHQPLCLGGVPRRSRSCPTHFNSLLNVKSWNLE